MCFLFRLPFSEPVPLVECARELLGVVFSEVPDKYYFALRQEHMVVEADATMQAIMEKLQVYRNRLTILFEVRIILLSFFPLLSVLRATLKPV